MGNKSAEFDFGAWLDAGAISTITVPINNNFDRSLLDEQESVKRAILEAEDALMKAREDADDDTLASTGDTTALEETIADLYDQFEDLYLRYKATELLVTVRALDPSETAQITAENIVPSPPKTLPIGASREQRRKYDRELAKWRTEASMAETLRNCEFIAAAIVSIESNGKKVADGMSPANLLALRGRPHGPKMFDALLDAVNTATNGEVKIDAPKSRVLSTSDKG